MKASNLLNTPYFLEFTTRLVCSENGSHVSIASSQFSTITSLSKGFDSSLNVLKFLIDIFEKTKANHLALECLTSRGGGAAVYCNYIFTVFIDIVLM